MPRKGRGSKAAKLRYQRNRMQAQQTNGQTVHSPSHPSARHGRKRLKSDILSASACSNSTSSWVPVIIDVFSLSDPKRGTLLSSQFSTADGEETIDDLVIQESSNLL